MVIRARIVLAATQGHPDTAILLNNRSLVAIDRGDLPAAHALLAESVAIRERSFDGAHPMLVGPLAVNDGERKPSSHPLQHFLHRHPGFGIPGGTAVSRAASSAAWSVPRGSR